MQEKARLERGLRAFRDLEGEHVDLTVLLELAIEEDDDDSLVEVESAIPRLETLLRTQELNRLLGAEGDESSAIVEVNPGAGGTEAQDWAQMLLRMLTRWGERRGYKTKLMDVLPGDEAGIKSATLSVEGEYAYGYLKSEVGVHRLVRISPFDANHRRHTSFASVAVYPQVDDTIEVELLDGDLRIDTYRASGAGGQHVNTTDSAVRITHLPTGIVVQCQNERSQHKNKAAALKVLRARIYELELEKQQAKAAEAQASKKKIEWGSQIRSYVLQPYRLVKDVRTGQESGNVDAVLDGDLDDFMDAFLVWQAAAETGRS
jgi:peptide chain release factor 2